METTQLGGRVETQETRLDEIILSLQALKDKCAAQDMWVESPLNQLDDYKERSRRTNIHISGNLSRDIICKLHKHSRNASCTTCGVPCTLILMELNCTSEKAFDRVDWL